MPSLSDRRRRVLRGLPPFEEILRGSVFVRTLRCGKLGCRCASGEGHSVAYLSVTHAGGRTEQISLPARLLPLARRWVANYLRWWQAIEKVSALNRQLLRELRRDAGEPRGGNRVRRRSPPRKR